MDKHHRRVYLSELTLVVVLTLVLFTALTIPHMEHGLAFIFPVPLAVFIIRYRVKDGIIPAIIFMIFAPIITAFLPLGGGSWIRGFLVMLTSVTIAFLHGGLHKTKISHFREIVIIIIVEICLGFIAMTVFYLAKDPVYSFSVEFPHYYHRFRELFGIGNTSVFSQNMSIIFQNMYIPYTLAMAMVEVLLTHILIHLVLKYVFELTHDRPFTGLNFSLSRLFAVLYLIGLALAGVSLFVMRNPIDSALMNAIIALFILVLGVMLLFIFQAVLLLILVMRTKYSREQSLAIFVVGLILSVPFSILGALTVIFDWNKKLMVRSSHALEH